MQPDGLPEAYSLWQILEHMRICQADYSRFCVDPDYTAPIWPDDHWPDTVAPPSEDAWNHSLNAFQRDLQLIKDLVDDSSADLAGEIPHAEAVRTREGGASHHGNMYAKEIAAVADHNAYPLGQFVTVRRLDVGRPRPWSRRRGRRRPNRLRARPTNPPASALFSEERRDRAAASPRRCLGCSAPHRSAALIDLFFPCLSPASPTVDPFLRPMTRHPEPGNAPEEHAPRRFGLSQFHLWMSASGLLACILLVFGTDYAGGGAAREWSGLLPDASIVAGLVLVVFNAFRKSVLVGENEIRKVQPLWSDQSVPTCEIRRIHVPTIEDGLWLYTDPDGNPALTIRGGLEASEELKELVIQHAPSDAAVTGLGHRANGSS